MNSVSSRSENLETWTNVHHDVDEMDKIIFVVDKLITICFQWHRYSNVQKTSLIIIDVDELLSGKSLPDRFSSYINIFTHMFASQYQNVYLSLYIYTSISTSLMEECKFNSKTFQFTSLSRAAETLFNVITVILNYCRLCLSVYRENKGRMENFQIH